MTDDLEKLRRQLREILAPADLPPLRPKKRTLRQERQQLYAPRATRARQLEAFIQRAPYLSTWQATVEYARQAHPPWRKTSVAKLAARWLNDYARKYGGDRVSYRTLLRHTIDPGPDQTFPDDHARLLR